MSNNFRYQPFVAVSGKVGGKVPVVDDVLLSHEQDIYPTTSLDENCIEFEFQTDRNYYVHLRQTYLALKLKLVKARGYENYNTKEVKKDYKEEAKAEEEETAAAEAVPLVTQVNNILHSIFSNVEVYINNQQIYNSKGMYAHKSYISNNFKGANSEYKAVLHCKGYDYEEFLDEIMEVPLSEPFFTRRMKMLSRPDGFMLYGELGVEFFSTSELLYPNMKIRLRLIRARPNSQPDQRQSWNCWLFTLHSSCCSQGWLSQETNGHACLHSCRVQLNWNSCKDFHHSCQTKPVHSGKHLQQCCSSSDCYCNDYKLCIHWIFYWKSILVSTFWSQTN